MAEFGWAYVVGTQTQGPSGSLQATQETGRLTGSKNLVYDDELGNLNLTGALNVSGAISANELNINVTNKNIINLSATGSTLFGDSTDDTHIFTGSLSLSSSANPITIFGLQDTPASSSSHYLALGENNQIVLTSSVSADDILIDEYTNPGNNRIITSIDASGINGEENFTFDGSLLSLTGSLSASVSVSSSLGLFSQITSSALKVTDISSETVSATSFIGQITTPSQTSITSVGTLGSLSVSGDLTVDTDVLKVNSTTNKVGIGRADPVRKLDVLSTDPQMRLAYSKYVSPGTENIHSDLYTTSDGFLILSASEQRVGIGTDSPSAMLDVNGDMRVSGNLHVSGTLSAQVTDFIVSANTITLGDSNSDTITFSGSNVSIPNDLNFSSDLLFLDNSPSRVGIGVDSPDAKLEILSTNKQLMLSYDQSNATSFNVDSAGNLNVNPSGVALTASSDLRVNGNAVLGRNCNDVITTEGQLTASCGISASVYVGTQVQASTGVFNTSIQVGSSTVQITSTTISGATTVTAGNYVGVISTPAQTNITSVGTLDSLAVTGDFTVDTDVLKVNSTTNKVGIGRIDPVRKLDVLTTDPQLRLAYSKYLVPGDQNIHSDLFTNSDGFLILSSSGQRVGIGTDSPTRTLDVGGDMRVAGNLEITGTLSARVTDFVVNADSIIFGNDGSDELIFNASSASIINGLNLDNNTLVIDSDQNRIGIGIPDPSAKLEIKTSALDQLRLTNGSNSVKFKVDSFGDLSIESSNFLTASANFKVSGSTMLGSLSTQHTVISGHLSASVAVSSSIGRFGNITGSALTDGTTLITGGNLSNVGTITATSVNATITKASQPNITSVGTLSGLSISGDLNVDSNTLFVKSSNDRVGLGRNDPERKLDILTTDPQLRLTYSRYLAPGDQSRHSDLYTDASGFLVVSSSGGKTKIDNNLQVTGLSSGTAVTTKYLALDAGNNIILTSSAPAGIETRNRRVITGNSSLSEDDYYIGISASSGILITLLDASDLVDGQTFTIKDEAGSANSHTFEVRASGSQTIDGQNSIFLVSPFAAINLYTNGVDKFFIF